MSTVERRWYALAWLARAASARAALLVAVILALPVVPAAGQEPEAPVRLAPVVVTPSRLEQRADEAPASVTVVTGEDIRESASQTVDDLLRQVPGFSLFRRSSSLVAHPTTQGLSLRGIGPSGTSRALVLLDGVPLNDPFGGWVPWSRLPLLGVEQIEVVRGGGSSVWGNYALGGVVHVVTAAPRERSAALEASYGSHDTHLVDLLLTEAWGPVRLSLEGRHFETGGYPIVKRSDRGPVDIDADSRHAVFNGRLELALSPDASLFVMGNYFDEERGNGTPLQVNETESGIVGLGGRLRAGDDEWRATLYAHLQEFRSTFSAQAADRTAETLALDQTVPTTSAGGWLQWSRRFGDHLVAAGAEARWTEGETRERVFVAGNFARTRVAGGEQWLGGVFVQDVWSPSPAWELVTGVRADYWTATEGARRDTPPPGGVPARQTFDDRDWLGLSPRVAGRVKVTPTTTLRASVYQGFRVPTINELYRVFRVRNDVTAANAELEPEQLVGGEAGLQQRWGPVEARVTGFWTEVEDLIANVTLASPLPDCPAGTTCRQRQNLDRARIRGVEAEVEIAPARDWRVLAAWLFSDARVVDAPAQRGLEGKRLAQVPEHTVTLGVRYRNPSILTAAVTARYVGQAYEDDLNTLPLGAYIVLDVLLARQLTRWAEVFLAVENLFDREYAVARTSEGVTSIGAPRLVRGGLRLTF